MAKKNDDLVKSLRTLTRDLSGEETEDDLFKSLSFEDTRELVRVAVQEKYKPKKQDKMKLYYGPWIREMFPDCVIITMEGKGEHYKLGYSIVDGKATLGEPVQVKQSWEPIVKSNNAEDEGVYVDDENGDDDLQKSEISAQSKFDKATYDGAKAASAAGVTRRRGAVKDPAEVTTGKMPDATIKQRQSRMLKKGEDKFDPLTEPNGPTSGSYTLDFDPPPEEFPRLMAPMTMESPDLVDGIDNRRTFVPNISALRPPLAVDGE